MHFDIEKHTIYEVLTGSRAYGFAREDSDYDYKGIAIPPLDTLYGFAYNFEQYEQGERTIYDIRKFFNLAKDCNPNVIELLWIPDKCVKTRSVWSDLLRENRHLFLSTKARFTFSGYAIAQLKRIQVHRKWLLNPVEKEPLREDYNLPSVSSLSTTVRNILKASTKEEIESMFGFGTSDYLKKELAYMQSRSNWEKYQEWRTSRNPSRFTLEEKYGYDCKHATHLVRLMKMCKEILTMGTIIVDRAEAGDAHLLQAIREGIWSYDYLIKWAEEQEREIEELYNTCTVLPKYPDVERLNDVCVSLINNFIGEV